jgi:hypothetical protein
MSMIGKPPASTPESKTVLLLLHLDHRTLRPAQVSDREVIFVDPPQLRTGHAVLESVVDDVAVSREIRILPHPTTSTRIPIELLGNAASVRQSA